MRIVCLMEDTPGQENYVYEHGLCLYIETANRRLLSDTGASGSFIPNAASEKINLEEIDIVILSHGHYDHTGGLLSFCEINSTAQIYMHKLAGGEYYNLRDGNEKYIGIDKNILKLETLHLIGGFNDLNDGITVFSDIKGNRLKPQGNAILKEKTENGYICDSFLHEQCTVIEEGNKSVLISGCAHNGILNILDKYKQLYNKLPDVVVSGFHMMKNSEYNDEETKLIKDTAEELVNMPTVFYTGHCTGIPAFCIMKEIMGDKLKLLHPGTEINI